VDLIPALDGPPVMEPGRLVAVGPLRIAPGGCVGNTGRALAALGVPTQLVAGVGDDRLNEALVGLLAAAGLGVDGIASLAGRGTSYSVVMDVPGRDRTIWHHVGANEAFTGEGLGERIRATGGGTILHLGYLTHLPGLLADVGGRMIELVAEAREAGAIVSTDVAEIDPGMAARAIDWPSLLARVLPNIDVFKASVDDLLSLGLRDEGGGPLEWARQLVAMGASVALVTAGAEGMVLATGPEVRLGAGWADREMWAPPLAERVIATTGAGDAAAAGFIASLADGRGPEEALALAAAAAAARIGGKPIAEARRMAQTAAIEPGSVPIVPSSQEVP
jgi:sugar/nucleoside kinase (ribokinase family)